MVQIIPAILAVSEEDYSRYISRYKDSQSFQEGSIHIDFMDNVFVPNKSIDPLVAAKYPINLQKEAHLMVEKPIEWIDKLTGAGFEKIFIHIEAEAIKESLDSIRKKGLHAGLAINSDTGIDKLEPFVSDIEAILVMSVKPGFQGQAFISGSFDKIKQIKGKNWSVSLGVDGAVKDTNIKDIISCGVDFVIVGSYLLEGDIDQNLENLWEAING